MTVLCFAEWIRASWALLAMNAQAKDYSPEEYVYRQGDDADGSFALIVSGKLEASTQQGYVLKTLCAGEIIGEVGTISQQQKRTVTLKAVEPVGPAPMEYRRYR